MKETPGAGSAFRLAAPFQPRGDQPEAIRALTEGLRAGLRHQTLLGVTGSGKTFTMAHVVAAINRPTLVLSHNKTLAAQLYGEFREFFPDNAVEYFVSYYDYYQPEAYVPQKDLYIEKDASINPNLDRLRLACTTSLATRRDVIVVSSVSCLYNLGSPEVFRGMATTLRTGETHDRNAILRQLVKLQYRRSPFDLDRGTFRARGDLLEVAPAGGTTAWRVRLDEDTIAAIEEFAPVSGELLRRAPSLTIHPAKHFLLPEERVGRAMETIGVELEETLARLRKEGKLVEAQRLEARTRYDMEMIREIGYCHGIENYSRHLDGREIGARPWTLIDHFPEGMLTIVDESHATLPQIRGMSAGDRARKETLVAHGFRLPSALDNRPLQFDEWASLTDTVVYVSATPAPYEIGKSEGRVVEQVLRPTGLLDPTIEVHPTEDQIPDLVRRIEARAKAKERTLVTTLTKRLAEELCVFLRERLIPVQYLHSDIDALERVTILRDLRAGKYDCVVGVNLLREGLDLPEVSLVAILDADKEGFLRSTTALVQTIGRTARHVNAHVVLYADRRTAAMDEAIRETQRRRALQEEYNRTHGITPQSIRKAIRDTLAEEIEHRGLAHELLAASEDQALTDEAVFDMEQEMHEAAREMKFERAAHLRDRILQLRPEWRPASSPGRPRRAAPDRTAPRGGKRKARKGRA